MAVLSNADRSECHAEYMREVSNARESFGSITKADLRAAVDALDSWFDTNAATINAAIPQPARNQLTTAQKARLIAAILLKRYAKGS